MKRRYFVSGVGLPGMAGAISLSAKNSRAEGCKIPVRAERDTSDDAADTYADFSAAPDEADFSAGSGCTASPSTDDCDEAAMGQRGLQ